MQTYRIGLVSILDRATRGVYVDYGCRHSKPRELRPDQLFTLEIRLVPDEQYLIEQTLRELVD